MKMEEKFAGRKLERIFEWEECNFSGMSSHSSCRRTSSSPQIRPGTKSGRILPN